MALPLGNLYLHLDSTNIASNPTTGNTWFDLTANNVDYGSGGDFPSFTTEGTVNTLTFVDGQGDLVFANDNIGDVITGTIPWTVEVYVKPSPMGNYKFLFGSFPPNEATGWGIKQINTETINFVFSVGGGEAIGPSISTPENVWVHLLFARDNNSSIRMYKDGALNTTWAIGTSIFTPSSLAYSTIAARTNVGGEHYNGEFGIVRVWDVALSGTQANEAYINAQNSIFPPPPPPPNIGSGRQFGEGFNG
jgi:hypothetical protein